MDLVAEMLLLNLKAPDLRSRRSDRAAALDGPPLHPAADGRVNGALAERADRITNRVWDYPRWLDDPA